MAMGFVKLRLIFHARTAISPESVLLPEEPLSAAQLLAHDIRALRKAPRAHACRDRRCGCSARSAG